MTPESQETRWARLQQRTEDLAAVVGQFGPMLVDQTRMDERLRQLLERVDELESDADEDRKAREKDRDDRRKFALTFAVSVAGLLIAFVGLVFVVLTFASSGG